MFCFKPSILAAVVLSTATVNALTGQGSYIDNNLKTTYFTPNSSIGACGVALDSQTDLSVALSSDQFGDGAHCGGTIKVQYNAKTAEATVVDRCVACSEADLDLSPAAFQTLASLDDEVIEVTWDYE
ncbi:RlpA-like double-psi beta-barrel-protein domain-containing protein-containing protein [Desarmillaria tabescens]|uniref:RlpA-like double-psi beta-barrel-protein domain-containing protein-containing protein n=1 Tax=Armillaria tabescens TaxID=1929756 RepID=A0AA39KCB7_ARMTA|nr:RlpA-like double-psi beta-barrel-protein domain-containing protein-containing protein [Desarmillaria tabescens]KAK0457350.1 RlpA-like double-psi beta-barrel-protein domain-containing protein-containing protein [Desarmillaria tabescens]